MADSIGAIPAYENTQKINDNADAKLPNGVFDEAAVGEIRDFEKQKSIQGNKHFHRLGWKRLTIVLIVEAIALGSLSLPQAFAKLGMVAGVIVCIGIGFIAIYTSYVVGQVKLKFPQTTHYADAGRLLMGRFGYELVGAMFTIQLIFLVGAHTLTGTIAFEVITGSGTCSLVWGVVSAIILLVLAIPPSFTELAILGYIDFTSIMAAIFITIIATGVKSHDAVGDLATANWSAWPPAHISFADVFVAITDIVFAYSFALCEFSFMDEMHTPADFPKSIWTLGLTEIVIYTLTGALIYAFVGQDVKSPALTSAGPLIAKVAYGISLPVIFISGSINGTVVGRYLHGRYYANSVVRYINTFKGWTTWLLLITVITIIGWIVAEAIPFFSDLLSISSALFMSGFSLYFPAWMWLKLIKKGSWRNGWHNISLTILNVLIFIIGLVVMVGGTYASIADIINEFSNSDLRSPFTCSSLV